MSLFPTITPEHWKLELARARATPNSISAQIKQLCRGEGQAALSNRDATCSSDHPASPARTLSSLPAVVGVRTAEATGSSAGGGQSIPRVLVACEYSARVRDAFRAQGCDAWSCDLEPCEGDPQWHIRGDVLDVLGDGWDMMIAHPPCTYLAASGMHWTVRGLRDPALTDRAADFFAKLYNAPIARKCIENPIGCMSKRLGAPTQKVQPWQFGDPESKLTCLWLVGLPPLVATHADGDLFAEGLPEREAHGKWRNQTASGQNNLRPGPDRWKERSRTYPGIARAMATQWAPLLFPDRSSVARCGSPAKHGEKQSNIKSEPVG